MMNDYDDDDDASSIVDATKRSKIRTLWMFKIVSPTGNLLKKRQEKEQKRRFFKFCSKINYIVAWRKKKILYGAVQTAEPMKDWSCRSVLLRFFKAGHVIVQGLSRDERLNLKTTVASHKHILIKEGHLFLGGFKPRLTPYSTSSMSGTIIRDKIAGHGWERIQERYDGVLIDYLQFEKFIERHQKTNAAFEREEERRERKRRGVKKSVVIDESLNTTFQFLTPEKEEEEDEC